MPNWVFNYLTVEGNPETVNELKEQVSMPFVVPVQSHGDLHFTVKDEKFDNPSFAFWNIIRPTDMEAYPKQPVHSDLSPNDPNWWADVTAKSKLDNSWYNWNNRNWGTKWDVANQAELVNEEENGENLVLVYQFDTAWSVPVPVIQKLSEQYPTLLLTLSYEEEQGWGGEMEFLRGSITAESEYDEKCHECDAINQMEYCDDCEVNVCLVCNMTREEEKCNHVGSSTNV
jgi:hypothetical protein